MNTTKDIEGTCITLGDKVRFKVDPTCGSINLDDRVLPWDSAKSTFYTYTGTVEEIHISGVMEVLVGKGILSNWAKAIPPEKVKKVEDAI